MAIVLFLFIKPSLSNPGDNAEGKDSFAVDYDEDVEGGVQAGLLKFDGNRNAAEEGGAAAASAEEHSWVDNLSTPTKKIMGVAMSVFSGLCYGLNFTPPR